jgi:hypothetical protein
MSLGVGEEDGVVIGVVEFTTGEKRTSEGGPDGGEGDGEQKPGQPAEHVSSGIACSWSMSDVRRELCNIQTLTLLSGRPQSTATSGCHSWLVVGHNVKLTSFQDKQKCLNDKEMVISSRSIVE